MTQPLETAAETGSESDPDASSGFSVFSQSFSLTPWLLD